MKRVNAEVILRDYLTAFWLSSEVSTRDPIISSGALDNGQGLIHGGKTKTP